LRRSGYLCVAIVEEAAGMAVEVMEEEAVEGRRL
jgi:hypothetical protein